jgi:NADH/NAD ratio-sensing transcriptional regulator Rex
VASGIKALWNFSPTQLVVPKRILMYHEHIALGLSVLAYHMSSRVPQAAAARP